MSKNIDSHKINWFNSKGLLQNCMGAWFIPHLFKNKNTSDLKNASTSIRKHVLTLITWDFPCFQNLASFKRLSMHSEREDVWLEGREVNSFLRANSDEVTTRLYLFSMSSFSVVLIRNRIKWKFKKKCTCSCQFRKINLHYCRYKWFFFSNFFFQKKSKFTQQASKWRKIFWNHLNIWFFQVHHRKVWQYVC